MLLCRTDQHLQETLPLAATVLCSSVCVMFLFVFPVFCFSNTISFTRDELLNIRQNTPKNLLPDFDYSDVLLDIVVGGAVALVKHFRTRRRGKRAGGLVKLRQLRLRTPLPSIHLANLRSLPNKTDEQLLLSQTNKDFSNSAALCFTETWLNDAIQDSMLHLPNFQLIGADHNAESMGNKALIKQISPVNCQNTDSTLVLSKVPTSIPFGTEILKTSISR